jgi:hypothetical protein
LRSLAVYASVLSGKPSVFGFWTVLHGVAAASEQLKAKFRLRHVSRFPTGHRRADKWRDHKDTKAFHLACTGDQRENLKSFKRRKRWL